MPDAPVPGLLERLAERIRRQGPLPYSAFVEAALYDPAGGFYLTGGQAGRTGDFLTSPEVGPLFGAVVARAVDTWWERLGRPDPFVVIECGAGAGTLARDVLAAGPACAPALRYLLVERSRRLRELQGGRVDLELPTFVLGPATAALDESGGGEPTPEPGKGPLAAPLEEIPAGTVTGVVVANELVDNLAFDLVERGSSSWQEVRVGLDAEAEAGALRLVEVLVPASGTLEAAAERFAPDAPAGARIPLQTEAQVWLRSALDAVERGGVVVIDYADETPALARRPWREWVRSYRAHTGGAGAQAGGGASPGGAPDPLRDPGSRDVTCEVAIDQLAAVAKPARRSSQAAWLRAHGIDELVAAARSEWEARAAVGDLAAVRARSRVLEAEALLDPAGLGGFTVLEWEVGRVRDR